MTQVDEASTPAGEDVEPDRGLVPFWERWVTPDGSWRRGRPPPGSDLAALRKGAGREPGTVPELWPYYTEDAWPSGMHDGGPPSRRFVAEHHALVLYGFHQQSKQFPVHRKGSRLGRALKALHVSGAFSQEAVDRRFRSAVAAEEVDHVAYHLRGMFTQLRSLDRARSLDYTRLSADLALWANASTRDRVRRCWGLDYYSFADDEGEGSDPPFDE